MPLQEEKSPPFGGRYRHVPILAIIFCVSFISAVSVASSTTISGRIMLFTEFSPIGVEHKWLRPKITRSKQRYTDEFVLLFEAGGRKAKEVLSQKVENVLGPSPLLKKALTKKSEKTVKKKKKAKKKQKKIVKKRIKKQFVIGKTYEKSLLAKIRNDRDRLFLTNDFAHGELVWGIRNVSSKHGVEVWVQNNTQNNRTYYLPKAKVDGIEVHFDGSVLAPSMRIFGGAPIKNTRQKKKLVIEFSAANVSNKKRTVKLKW